MNESVKIFIAISIVLNVLLAGLVIGHAGQYMMSPSEYRHHSLHELAGVLPEEKRQHFEKRLADFKKTDTQTREQIIEARKNSLELLKAEPFDKKAYLAQVKTLQQLRVQSMQQMAEAIAGLAAECTPQQREQLAEILRPPHRE